LAHAGRRFGLGGPDRLENGKHVFDGDLLDGLFTDDGIGVGGVDYG